MVTTVLKAKPTKFTNTLSLRTDLAKIKGRTVSSSNSYGTSITQVLEGVKLMLVKQKVKATFA